MNGKIAWLGVMLAACTTAFALTEEVNGIEWTYQIVGEEAEIYNGGSAAIPMATAGAITVPDTLGGKPVTSIGNNAFEFCGSLTSVTIPDTVTSIGEAAFNSCATLGEVTIPPSVISIGNYAFSSCYLTRVTVPDGVARIGTYAFYNCSFLKEANLPVQFAGVIDKASDAFQNCHSDLVVVYRETVAGIPWRFRIIDGKATLYGDIATAPAIPNTTAGHVVIPPRLGGYDVTGIGREAFYGCDALTSVWIPDTVTLVGSSAFDKCHALKGIVIPDSVERIEDYAFYDCDALTDIAIPDSVTTIGSSVFTFCSKLKKVSVEIGKTATVTALIEASGYSASGLTFTEDYSVSDHETVDGLVWRYRIVGEEAEIYNDGAAAIPSSTSGALTVPGTLGGKPVTRIGYSAFVGCGSLTSVTIPETVTSIGDGAFANCSSLASVTIPDAVTSIGDQAFWGCAAMADGNGFIVVRSVLHGYVGTDEYVDVPMDVTRIGTAAFAYNSLKYVWIPDTVTSIGNDAFYDCDALTGATIPGSVKCIGASAFEACAALTDVTIMAGVTHVGDFAFWDSALTDIEIPKSVTSIGTSAFSVTPLATVYVEPGDNTRVSGLILASGKDPSGLTFSQILASSFTVTFDAGSGTVSETSRTVASGAMVGALPTPTLEGYKFHGWVNSDDIRATPLTVVAEDTTLYAYWIPEEYDWWTDARGVEWIYRIVDDEAEIFNEGYPAIPRWTRGDVTVPATLGGKPVTHIGNSAFDNCNALTSVTLPDGLTSIGAWAFFDCASLTAVTIPGSVTDIGDQAFWGCPRMADENGFVIVRDVLYFYAGSATDVTIPSGVKTIGANAFQYAALTSVTIPSSVKTIGANAFSYCYSLTDVTLSDGVASIEDSAFDSCSSLANITIPNTVTNIGDWAFYDCDALTDVTIPSGLTSIAMGMFCECDALASIMIPSAVTSIEDYAFQNCVALADVDIPQSVTSIGALAFQNCVALTDVTLPVGVASIGDSAFQDCSSLADMDIPQSVTSIGNYAFYNCVALADVTIPSSVKSIGDYAFYFCSALTQVEIPGSVTSIGADAFGMCTTMTDVWMAYGVTSIGDYAFYGCVYLTDVTIPGSVTSIGEHAFHGTALTEVTIPASVTAIGERTFYLCPSLTDISIPKSVTSIGADAFDGTALATVYVEAGDATRVSNLILASGKDPSGLTFEEDLPSSFTVEFVAYGGIVSEDFRVVSSGEAVGSLPIPERDGYGFHGWFTESDGDGVQVTSATVVADDMTCYAYWLPDDCDSYTDAKGIRWIYRIVNGEVEIYNDGDAAIPSSTAGAIVVPDEIAGKPVTRIGAYAFYGCDLLTAVTIPPSVTSIGDGAFCLCARLADDDGFVIVRDVIYSYFGPAAVLTLPSGVTGIGGYAFSANPNLTEVEIPASVTNIGPNAFSFCAALTAAPIPDSVASIGESAFEGCTALTAVTIPAGVTSIEDNTFALCYALPDVEIPVGVTSIGESAFYNCEKLTSLTIPDGVESIKEKAFEGCAALTTATIPTSVTTIGTDAFAGTALATVHVVGGDGERIKSLLEGSGYVVSGITFKEHCIVTFDANGADGGSTADMIGGEPLVPPTLSRTGYDFNGWDSEVPPTVPLLPSVKYTAIWTLKWVTVTFDANGGEGDERLENSYGEPLTPPTVSREGYTFVKWIPAVPPTIPAEDTTYVAQWTVNKYKVTFDANGGEGGTTETLDYGTPLTPPTVTRKGYTFKGWSPEVPNTVPAEDATYVAQWTPNSGDSGTDDPGTKPGTDEPGTKPGTDEPGTKPGTDEPGTKPGTDEPGTKQQVWTVTFNANGGVGTMADQTYTNGITQALAANAFTRFGYAFVGWNTLPDDTGLAFADGALVSLTTNTTLYAQWEEIHAGQLAVSFAKAQTVDGALYGTNDTLVGTVQVKAGKINKKGAVKLSASATLLLDGKAKKVTAKAVNLTAESDGTMGGTLVFKAPIGTMAFTMAKDGAFMLKSASYLMAEATVGGALNGDSRKFRLEKDFHLDVQGELQGQLLPYEEVFSSVGGKWKFSKATTVKWAKNKQTMEYGLVVDESKAKTNRSALKLSYVVKTGIFKGTFKAYALEAKNGKTKLVKYTVNVIGVVVDGAGYGNASCKKPASGPWAVTVE